MDRSQASPAWLSRFRENYSISSRKATKSRGQAERLTQDELESSLDGFYTAFEIH